MSEPFPRPGDGSVPPACLIHSSLLMLLIAAMINLWRLLPSPPVLLSAALTGHLHQLTPAWNSVNKCRGFRTLGFDMTPQLPYKYPDRAVTNGFTSRPVCSEGCRRVCIQNIQRQKGSEIEISTSGFGCKKSKRLYYEWEEHWFGELRLLHTIIISFPKVTSVLVCVPCLF